MPASANAHTATSECPECLGTGRHNGGRYHGAERDETCWPCGGTGEWANTCWSPTPDEQVICSIAASPQPKAPHVAPTGVDEHASASQLAPLSGTEVEQVAPHEHDAWCLVSRLANGDERTHNSHNLGHAQRDPGGLGHGYLRVPGLAREALVTPRESTSDCLVPATPENRALSLNPAPLRRGYMSTERAPPSHREYERLAAAFSAGAEYMRRSAGLVQSRVRLYDDEDLLPRIYMPDAERVAAAAEGYIAAGLHQ